MVFFWLLIFFSNCSFEFCSITLCQFNKWISFYISFFCYKNKVKKRISCFFAITGRFYKTLTIKRLSFCPITIWIQGHAIWCKTGLYSTIDPKETSLIWKHDCSIQMIRYITICTARINDRYKARFILRLINGNWPIINNPVNIAITITWL